MRETWDSVCSKCVEVFGQAPRGVGIVFYFDGQEVVQDEPMGYYAVPAIPDGKKKGDERVAEWILFC